MRSSIVKVRGVVIPVTVCGGVRVKCCVVFFVSCVCVCDLCRVLFARASVLGLCLFVSVTCFLSCR